MKKHQPRQSPPPTEPKFAPGVPVASDRLTKTARAEYARVADLCREAGRELQQVDCAVLEVYAQSFDDYWRHDAELRKPGVEEVLTLPNGFRQVHPLFQLREAAWKRLAAAAGKLGFSPADRSRQGTKESPRKYDPLAEFVG
jgi:P27 family predicted phage terminase small subunit